MTVRINSELFFSEKYSSNVCLTTTRYKNNPQKERTILIKIAVFKNTFVPRIISCKKLKIRKTVKTADCENNNLTASILEECRIMPEYVRNSQKKNKLIPKKELTKMIL